LGEYERLMFEGRSYTNRKLHRSRRLAAGLPDRRLQPDDRVALVTSECPKMVAMYPAVWHAGMAIVRAPPLEEHELKCILENSAAGERAELAGNRTS
jgi:acyl-CoA synthetase (AMP-forming)/AMP-acid ligase II